MPVWLSFYGQCNVDLYFDKRRGTTGKHVYDTQIYSKKSGEKLKKYDRTHEYFYAYHIVRFTTQIYILFLTKYNL